MILLILIAVCHSLYTYSNLMWLLHTDLYITTFMAVQRFFFVFFYALGRRILHVKKIYLMGH